MLCNNDIYQSLYNIEIVNAVQKHPYTVLSIGGNAALMASRVAKMSGKALLCGVGPQLNELLSDKIEIVDAEQDEYHLILEYQVGETFYDVTTQRANRFILHSDDTNGKVLALESCHAALHRFGAHMFVAAGLHLLQEQSEQYRVARVAAVKERLSLIKPDVAIHLELASIGEAAFLRHLAETLLSDVDSLGLNEQELGDVYKALGGKQHAPAAFARAERAAVLDALALVFEFADRLAEPSRQLTRIHFHYLTYHIIATRGQRWSNTAAACAAGSAAASNQACALESAAGAGRAFDPTLVELRTPAADPLVVASLPRHVATYYLVPVLVCRRPLRTVGLGDAVSSSALATQVFQ
jgi:ADP-dependent glucokinase